MGSTSYLLGYIEISPVEENQFVWVFIFICIGVLAACVIPFLCYRKFCSRKPTHHIDIALSDQNEQRNDYRHAPAGTAPVASRQSRQLIGRSISVVTDEGISVPLLNEHNMSQLAASGFIIQEEDLVIAEYINQGQFGRVFKGYLQRPNAERINVAIKTLHEHLWCNPSQTESFLKEAMCMKQFKHPNVLELIGVCFTETVPQIILPYMENKDLLSYIAVTTKELLKSDLLEFAVDVASGMCYLSKEKFVHRDLAARNCFLDSACRVKVADFGLSRDVYESEYYSSEDLKALIPYKWTAPEAIEKKRYSIKSDVWSFGVVLWELMTRGSIPYAFILNWELGNYLQSGRRLDRPEYCPLPLYIAMLACWNADPKVRPEFTELRSYISEIRQRLLDSIQAEAVVAQNSFYCNVTVPAQHMVYVRSEELYCQMQGQPLRREALDE